MPTFQSNSGNGVPNVAKTMGMVRTFEDSPFDIVPSFYSITGITRDLTGAALPSCQVELYRTADDSAVSRVTSDANGLYIMPASPLLQHYLVAYKVGSPDVAGTTINTLTGT